MIPKSYIQTVKNMAIANMAPPKEFIYNLLDSRGFLFLPDQIYCSLYNSVLRVLKTGSSIGLYYSICVPSQRS